MSTTGRASAEKTRPGTSAAPRGAGRAGAVLVCAFLAACAERPGADAALAERPAEQAEALHRVLSTEDLRAPTDAELGTLRQATRSDDAAVRRVAVRALGRLERPELLADLVPRLSDPDPGIRSEAANAVAQAVLRAEPGGQAASEARSALLDRLAGEGDASVRGALAQSLGRVRHDSPEAVAGTADAIVAAAVAGADPVRVARGLHFLVRQPPARGAVPEPAVAHLRTVVAAAGEAGDVVAVRARTLAVQALTAAGALTVADADAAFADADPLVRREVVVAAPGLGAPNATRSLLERGLADPSHIVRYDALRGWNRAEEGELCPRAATAARDVSDHVALLAIDLLGSCPGDSTVAFLDSLAVTVPQPGPAAPWHRPAHALVSLARLDPARATERLLPFVAHDDPFVRAYAASAASVVDEEATLRLLVGDESPNVRVAALPALARIQTRDGLDAVLLRQLESNDPQLLMTTAELLEGTTAPAALPALLDALDRVTVRRRQTERDARMALLERIEALGGPADAARLRPFLADFDAVVADRAADALASWTGERPETSPEPLAPAPVPTPARLDSLSAATFTVEMEGGGSFDLRLLAWDAPTNADRFARLAESGYFDGLTYHRVVPNFVVQGGSPGANEYAGDGPFTRDELGLDGNWRGTVGLSTRGRDTGDGQMFINLVDNVRLDHEYTVFAEVVRGMDLVDGLQEGARIVRVIRSTP